MVQKCFLCKKWSYTFEELSFHRFPSDLTRRNEWLKNLKLENSEVPWTAVICSEHFSDGDYTVRVKTKYLKKTSIPMFYSSDKKDDPEPSPSNVHQSSDEDCTAPVISSSSETSSAPDTQLPQVNSVKSESDLEIIAPRESNVLQSKDEDCTAPVISSSSETSTASDTESPQVDSVRSDSDLQIIAPTKRRRKTVNSFNCADFSSTPREAKRLFTQMRTTLMNKNKKIRNLHQNVRRLRARVNNLKSLIKVLKNRRLTSDNAESTITASLPTNSSENQIED